MANLFTPALGESPGSAAGEVFLLCITGDGLLELAQELRDELRE